MNDIENKDLVNFAPERDPEDNSVARKKPGPKPKQKPEPALPPIDKSVSQMNDLANRIWEGQSPSLPLNERVRRIKNSLIERGFTEELSQLILPGKEYKRFL